MGKASAPVIVTVVAVVATVCRCVQPLEQQLLRRQWVLRELPQPLERLPLGACCD